MKKETNSSITYFETFLSGSFQKEIKIFCSGRDGKSIFNDQEQFCERNDTKKLFVDSFTGDNSELPVG